MRLDFLYHIMDSDSLVPLTDVTQYIGKHFILIRSLSPRRDPTDIREPGLKSEAPEWK